MAMQKRFAWLLSAALAAAGLLLVAAPAASFLMPELSPGAGAGPVPASEAWIVKLAVAPSYLSLAIGLFGLIGFARRLARGTVFVRGTASAMAWFGWCVVAGALLHIAGRLAAGWAIGLGFAALIGPSHVVGAATGLAFGLLLIAFAAVVHEGCRLAAENAEFV